MTEAELLAAYWDTFGRMDSNFEFWLSGTFAMLLTFYFAGNRIDKKMKWLLVTLYATFSITFIARFMSWVSVSGLIRDDLVAVNSSYLALSEGQSMTFSIGFALVFALGFFGTLFFAFRGPGSVNSKSEIDT